MPWVRLRQESIDIESELSRVWFRARWECGNLECSLDAIISRPPAFIPFYRHVNTHPFSLRRGEEHNMEPKSFVTSCVRFASCFAFSEFQILDRPTTPTRISFHWARHSSNGAQYSPEKNAYFLLLWQKLGFLSDSSLQLSLRNHALSLKILAGNAIFEITGGLRE